MWNRIKNTEGKYKYDIDSIIDEQITFYSKLFTTEGWDENSANKLTQHIESKLNGDEKETLELDVSIEEIKNVLKILKPNKSPGEDGIISEFYITHWEQIKDEFFLLVNDTFDKKELTPSQYKGVLTLLHKSGEREDIRNWRPLTLLNSDYKIIAKILAERLKVVLPKLIHSDQKGFVKGRNISEANRLIQDVI